MDIEEKIKKYKYLGDVMEFSEKMKEERESEIERVNNDMKYRHDIFELLKSNYKVNPLFDKLSNIIDKENEQTLIYKNALEDKNINDIQLMGIRDNYIKSINKLKSEVGELIEEIRRV